MIECASAHVCLEWQPEVQNVAASACFDRAQRIANALVDSSAHERKYAGLSWSVA